MEVQLRPKSLEGANFRLPDRSQLVLFFFFFFEPILFWNTSQRLSPVVTTSRYICETYGKRKVAPHQSESTSVRDSIQR
jgi:hypothetical protein